MAAAMRDVSRTVPIVILVLHASLLAWASARQSPTLDELGHLPAGICHWQLRRFDLYRVNPPLVRMVAVLPVLADAPEPEWRFPRSPDDRPHWQIGRDLIRSSGERAFSYFTWARWACIPFSLVGGYICLRWARELYGPTAGVVALILWCFSPTILGNASLIIPDVGAAAMGVAAGYTFWLWLRDPGWRRAAACGLMLGLALLSKTTWIVLLGLWPLVWCAQGRPRGWLSGDSRRPPVTQLGAVVLIGIYLLNAGYCFEGSFRKLGTFGFVSASLSGLAPPTEPGSPPPIGNRFADSWLGMIPMPFPEAYVSGIDIQKLDFERGLFSYLRGQTQSKGWWYYYLYALVIKIPVGIFVLLFLALAVRTTSSLGGSLSRDDLVLLMPPLVLLVVVSMNTGFARYLRYLLPAFPFVFVWISSAARSVPARNRVAASVGVLSLAWLIAGSLFVYPHSLSYFNLLAGGPLRGHRHLIDANIDWGQDLFYLRRWVNSRSWTEPLYIAYFGGFDARHAGLEFDSPPQGPIIGSRTPRVDDEVGPLPGWYAVSINILRGYPGRNAQVYWDDFLELQPVTRAGYSIYVYRLTRTQANRIRNRYGLPPLSM